MSRFAAFQRQVLAFRRSEKGTTMVELGLSIAIFCLVLFTAIDFARFYFHFVASEKSIADATRLAAVRPAICANVPETNQRDASADASAVLPDYGASCLGGLVNASGDTVAGGICNSVTLSCTIAGATGDVAVADEIWARVGRLLPPGATRANIRVSYEFDPALNFLGGPFVPNVSMEITNLDFEFISPIGPLARLAGAATATFDQSPPFPSLRTVVPGEDLAAGNNG